MRDHRDLNSEDGRGNHGSKKRLVTLIVGVGDKSDAGRDEFRTRGLDVDGLATVRAGEADAMVGAWSLTILEFGLGNRCAEGHVPQGGRLGLVRLAPGQVVEECTLADGSRVVINGLVILRPVDREAQASPQLLEDLFILDGQTLTQFDKVASGYRYLHLGIGLDRRLKGWVVREGRVAAHTVEVLNSAFRG